MNVGQQMVHMHTKLTSSISWPRMQKYLDHIYKSGKPLEVWFNFQLNRQTATVIDAYPGRVRERKRIDGV
jgi:hypothetical protein